MKPVCVKCGLEMTITNIGVDAISMFLDPPEPYQIFNGDEFTCMNCGYMIVARFPTRAYRQHHEQDFTDKISGYLEGGEKFVLVWEKIKHSQQFAADPIGYLSLILVEILKRKEGQ